MEWLVLFFFLPFILTLMFFNWLEEKFINFGNIEQLEAGEKMLEAKQYVQARDFFAYKLNDFPKSARAYYGRAYANFHLKNYFSALYDIEESISFDNTVADAYLLKGKILYYLEEYDQAFLEFDKADWHYRNENPVALRWRGIARFQLGQRRLAIDDFNKAVALGDEDANYILITSFEYIRNLAE